LGSYETQAISEGIWLTHGSGSCNALFAILWHKTEHKRASKLHVHPKIILYICIIHRTLETTIIKKPDKDYKANVSLNVDKVVKHENLQHERAVKCWFWNEITATKYYFKCTESLENKF